MVQICPHCRKTIPEDAVICPHCNSKLSSDNKICPFCKRPISEYDTICPHCNKLLIYEYPKQVTAKRNAVLFPLGFLILISIVVFWFLRWQGWIGSNWILEGILLIFWLTGIVLYGAYIGKGDKDFFWGK